MKLTPKKSLIILISLTLIALIVYFLLNKNSQDPAVPTEVEVTDNAPLRVTIEPKPGELPVGGTTTGISLFFDGTVDISSIETEVFPPFNLVPRTLADFSDRIILTPTSPWQTGITYRITIKKGVQAEVSGRTLMDDIVLEYVITEVPELEEEFSPHL